MFYINMYISLYSLSYTGVCVYLTMYFFNLALNIKKCSARALDI